MTDLTKYSCPLKPVQMMMTTVSGKPFSVSDLFCSYHQVPLSRETQKLTSFIIGGKQYTYTRGFHGLCGLSNFFSRLMTFRPSHQEETSNHLHRRYNNAVSKQERVVHGYQRVLYPFYEGRSQSSSRQNVLFLKQSQVSWSRHISRRNPTFCRTSNRLEESQITRKKRDVMKFLGCLGFYSCYFKNLHVDSQPFYDLIKDSAPFHWTHEHEKLLQSIKDRISEDTILAVPFTHYPFHIHVDSANAGTGYILIQQFPQGKTDHLIQLEDL